MHDANRLYQEGIQVVSMHFSCTIAFDHIVPPPTFTARQVVWQNEHYHFYFRFLGAKGDWPWLRSVYDLKTGFTSKVICHICHGTDPQLHL